MLLRAEGPLPLDSEWEADLEEPNYDVFARLLADLKGLKRGRDRFLTCIWSQKCVCHWVCEVDQGKEWSALAAHYRSSHVLPHVSSKARGSLHSTANYGTARFPVTWHGDELANIWLWLSGRSKSKEVAKKETCLDHCMFIAIFFGEWLQWNRRSHFEPVCSVTIFFKSVPRSHVHLSNGGWTWAAFGEVLVSLPYMALHVCVTVAG